ncbi:MAG: hypothetical protein OEZ06_08520 [Myxococcales bacterium]|nr:hypothetical protein [Myxococcales bacterium]
MKRLPQLGAAQAGLGQPTIMDVALAATHGVHYVHLAAFAIDVDRLYAHFEEREQQLPFAWEVFLCERYLQLKWSQEDEDAAGDETMLEEICMGILEQPPQEQGLGSQLLFAVYHGVQRGWLPASLKRVFHRWRSRPKQLLSALDRLSAGATDPLPELARRCLEAELLPPLSAPTRESLEAMASGESEGGEGA